MGQRSRGTMGQMLLPVMVTAYLNCFFFLICYIHSTFVQGVLCKCYHQHSIEGTCVRIPFAAVSKVGQFCSVRVAAVHPVVSMRCG